MLSRPAQHTIYSCLRINYVTCKAQLSSLRSPNRLPNPELSLRTSVSRLIASSGGDLDATLSALPITVNLNDFISSPFRMRNLLQTLLPAYAWRPATLEKICFALGLDPTDPVTHCLWRTALNNALLWRPLGPDGRLIMLPNGSKIATRGLSSEEAHEAVQIARRATDTFVAANENKGELQKEAVCDLFLQSLTRFSVVPDRETLLQRAVASALKAGRLPEAVGRIVLSATHEEAMSYMRLQRPVPQHIVRWQAMYLFNLSLPHVTVTPPALTARYMMSFPGLRRELLGIYLTASQRLWKISLDPVTRVLSVHEKDDESYIAAQQSKIGEFAQAVERELGPDVEQFNAFLSILGYAGQKEKVVALYDKWTSSQDISTAQYTSD